MFHSTSDEEWMAEALKQAFLAQEKGEVPVGAIIVYENSIFSTGYNQVITRCDPSAHAEIIAIRNAGQKLANYRLVNMRMYVTLEPCVMCVGALIHARISEVIYATPDPKTGACQSAFQLFTPGLHNHTVQYRSGILSQQAGKILKDFF